MCRRERPQGAFFCCSAPAEVGLTGRSFSAGRPMNTPIQTMATMAEQKADRMGNPLDQSQKNFFI